MAGTQELEAKIYRKLHARRFEHVEQARRARDAQIKLAEIEATTMWMRMVRLLKSLWDDETSK